MVLEGLGEHSYPHVMKAHEVEGSMPFRVGDMANPCLGRTWDGLIAD